MQTVAAAWMMTSLTPSPVMASLVQTASSLPMFLLALVSGAVADSIDRRRLLLIAQSWMLLIAALLGVLTIAGWTGPWTLLLLTFALGLGAAMTAPAWAATIPELVPDEQLAQAVTLNSVQFNVARAAGPAAAGVVLAWSGPGGAFLVNALSFVGIVATVYFWRAERRGNFGSLTALGPALREGLRFVGGTAGYGRVMFDAGSFTLFGSATWALLPVVARRQLSATEGEYGLMLSCLGMGAVVAGVWLAQSRSRWDSRHLLSGGIGLFAIASAGLSRATSVGPAYLWLLAGGFAWIAVMSSLTVLVQGLLPNWVRGRGLSIYMLIFQGAMAGGSWMWGGVADRLGAGRALVVAASGMAAVSAAVLLRFRNQPAVRQ
jgi:MFS family permease